MIIVNEEGLFKNKIDSKSFADFILAVLLPFLTKIGVDYISFKHFDITILNEYLITYVSPFIVLSSVFLVMIFRKIKINQYITKIITFMSPLTFGIYLIHTQYYVWEYLDNRFVNYVSMKPVWFVVSVIFTAVIIYLVCSIVDCIRQYIFRLFKIKKVSEYADKFVCNFLS